MTTVTKYSGNIDDILLAHIERASPSYAKWLDRVSWPDGELLIFSFVYRSDGTMDDGIPLRSTVRVDLGDCEVLLSPTPATIYEDRFTYRHLEAKVEVLLVSAERYTEDTDDQCEWLLTYELGDVSVDNK